MRTRIILGAAGSGSVLLVLVAICVVVAQNPYSTGSRPARVTAANPSLVATEEPRSIAPGSTSRVPSRPSTHPGGDDTGIYAGTSSLPTKPAAIDLRSGLKLDGQLATGPIACQLMFGEISLPVETIRGIRLSDELATDEGGQARPTSATIILENGDSLTGMLRLNEIRLRTEWGEAVVKLTHLKSLVLTSESVEWQEHEGRWRLIPVALPTSEAEALDAPAFEPSSSAGSPIPTPVLPDSTTPAPVIDLTK